MMGPLASFFCAKFSCRTVSILGHMIIVVGMLISSFVTDLNILFFTYGILTGVGIALPLLANFVIVAKYFHKYRSLANSALTVGVSLGILSINPGIQTLLERTSLKTCFQVLSAMHVVPCLLAITFDPSIEEECEKTVKHKVRENAATSSAESYFSVCSNPAVILVLCSWIFFEVGHYIPFIHLVSHCQILGISKENASELYIYFGIAGIVGRITSGILADHFRINKVYIAQWGALYLLGASALFLPLARTYSWLIVYMIVYGFSDGVEISTYSCLMYDLTGPRQHTQALGFLFFAMSFPLAVGPPIGGMLADKFGSYDAAFYLAGVVSIFGGFLLTFVNCVGKKISNAEIVFTTMTDEEFIVIEKETVL